MDTKYKYIVIYSKKTEDMCLYIIIVFAVDI